MYTRAESFGCGPNTTYLLFDEVRGWHMHSYPYHDEDRDDLPPELGKVCQ